MTVSRWNPANLLTLLRIVLVPVFAAAMLYHHPAVAFAVFVMAALTDLLDGWMARRYGWVTALGAFIDPLADKLLQLTAVTLLAVQGNVALWMVVLVWAREVVVVSGFSVLALLAVSREVRSSWWGKAGTLAQMTAIGAVLWVGIGPTSEAGEALGGLYLGLAVALNFLSGLEYAWNGFRAYEDREQGQPLG